MDDLGEGVRRDQFELNYIKVLIFLFDDAYYIDLHAILIDNFIG